MIRTISYLLLLLITFMMAMTGCAPAPGSQWEWRHFHQPFDIVNFLNGTGDYTHPVKDARISAVWKNNSIVFTVFYQPGQTQEPKGRWVWMKVTTPQQVYSHLNGSGPSPRPVEDARICVTWKDDHAEYYVFYKPGTPGHPAVRWGWKKSTTTDDVKDFLNGKGNYLYPVSTARIAAMKKNGAPEFHIFFKRAAIQGEIPNWSEGKESSSPNDVRNFLNGSTPYRQRVKGSDICAVLIGDQTTYHVFPNQGPKAWITRPLDNERFVTQETVTFEAFLTSDEPVDGSRLQWISSIDGNLGSGVLMERNGLSTGNHTIEATVNGHPTPIPIRVFNDLWELYQSPPAQGEIDRIKKDFNLVYSDGTGEDELWAPYDNYNFDQTSHNPTKIAIIAKLDILRHQRFSETLPFTDGKTIYDHLKTYIHTIYLKLSCEYAHGGGGTITLSRGASLWGISIDGTVEDPEACKHPVAYELKPYCLFLGGLIHEERHSEPDDPGHVRCLGKTNMDVRLEGGSGHAWGALYWIWVYRYGLYDPPSENEMARRVLRTVLRTRFCTRPTHSDPRVQAILDEIIDW